MRVVWKNSVMHGEMILGLGHDHDLAHGWVEATADLRAGLVLTTASFAVRLLATLPLGLGQDLFGPAWLCSAMQGQPAAGQYDGALSRDGLSVAWITLSDKGSRGERIDASGPAIRDCVAEQLPVSLARGVIIPDEPQLLKAALVQFCLQHRFDLVFTTGGTGVGPRDITPETTMPLLDKRLPGFERAMTALSLAKTPHAMISRAVAGTLGQSVVVNLPGSPKAVRENLAAILPALRHTVEKLQGDPRDCGQ